ncbi:unnamed protein product, partial [marine sediment metagenome]
EASGYRATTEIASLVMTGFTEYSPFKAVNYLRGDNIEDLLALQFLFCELQNEGKGSSRSL